VIVGINPDILSTGKCELCNQVAETRPYGEFGENICFDCGVKDEETTKKQFAKFINANFKFY